MFEHVLEAISQEELDDLLQAIKQADGNSARWTNAKCIANLMQGMSMKFYPHLKNENNRLNFFNDKWLDDLSDIGYKYRSRRSRRRRTKAEPRIVSLRNVPPAALARYLAKSSNRDNKVSVLGGLGEPIPFELAVVLYDLHADDNYMLRNQWHFNSLDREAKLKYASQNPEILIEHAMLDFELIKLALDRLPYEKICRMLSTKTLADYSTKIVVLLLKHDVRFVRFLNGDIMRETLDKINPVELTRAVNEVVQNMEERERKENGE